MFSKRSWPLLAIFTLIISLTSCYEPVEGCLDPESENYSLSADENCCCDYPDRGLKVEYKWDSLTFRFNRKYENAMGDSFQVTQLRYQAGDFRWMVGGETWEVEDSLRGFEVLSDQLVYVKDDWVTLGPGIGDVEAGALRKNGVVDSMSVKMGYNYPDGLRLEVPNGHPLDSGSNIVFDKVNKEWNALVVTVIHGIDYSDTTKFFATPDEPLPIFLSESFEMPLGKDHDLQMTVQMKDWFGEIDWNVDEEEVKRQIVSFWAIGHRISP